MRSNLALAAAVAFGAAAALGAAFALIQVLG